MKTKWYDPLFTLIFIPVLCVHTYSQPEIKAVNKTITADQVYTDMMFIASDELKGRKTGEPGNQIAAKYIADQFRKTGLQKVPGMKDYFQPIPFTKFYPPLTGAVKINEAEFNVTGNMIILAGGQIKNENNEAIFADFGWMDSINGIDDYQGLDVRGKYVIVHGGLPQGGSLLEVHESMPQKRKLAQSKGALGLIEIYGLAFNWNFFKGFYNKERLEVLSSSDSTSIFHSWIKTSGEGLIFNRGEKYKISLSTSGIQRNNVEAVNVIGMIPGKNSQLKDQYIMLSAHFDHVGTNAGSPNGNDTIWNGARDNAWGTVSLISAARFFTKYPAERSIVIAAVNGEEMGLLGSKYLAGHPVVPWNKVIFDLNTDGAGYSDTSMVSIIGLNRVGAAEEITQGCKAAGLNVFADPAPEQRLFDRSDNVSFALLGIPSPTFGAGFTSFNSEIARYYHQAIDNPDSISYGYLLRFCKAFALSALNIANMKSSPKWAIGDKYEAAAKKLYNY